MHLLLSLAGFRYHTHVGNVHMRVSSASLYIVASLTSNVMSYVKVQCQFDSSSTVARQYKGMLIGS